MHKFIPFRSKTQRKSLREVDTRTTSISRPSSLLIPDETPVMIKPSDKISVAEPNPPVGLDQHQHHVADEPTDQQVDRLGRTSTSDCRFLIKAKTRSSILSVLSLLDTSWHIAAHRCIELKANRSSCSGRNHFTRAQLRSSVNIVARRLLEMRWGDSTTTGRHTETTLG